MKPRRASTDQPVDLDSTGLLSADRVTVSDRSGRVLTNAVSLEIGRGEAVALVGESGSGKTLTARALAGLLPSNLTAQGSARLDGQELLGRSERAMRRLRGAKLSLLMQDPFTMLHPLRRVSSHLSESLSVPRADVKDEIQRRLREVQINDPVVAGRYPFQLSGGMLQRAALATALAGDPDLLIADEPTTALDVTTQQQILALLRDVQRTRGMGLLLITHDLNLAFSTCDRVVVLYAGSVMEVGAARELARSPAHPYTAALLRATPSIAANAGLPRALPGSVPAAAEVMHTCAFAPRCEFAQPRCTEQRPPLRNIAPGRASACLRYGENQLAVGPGHGAIKLARTAAAGGGEALTVEKLTKIYGAGGSGQSGPRVLSEVSLSIAEGERLAIVGESGSGKTTLARCVLGLTQATSGRITIGGLDVTDRRHLTRVQRDTVCRNIQCVFQDPYTSLNPAHSIGFTLREAAARTGREHVRTPAELLELVGLPAEYAKRRPAALSGGQRQRVAIARALAVEPRLLLCDEPTASLDVSVQTQIVGLLQELNRKLGTSLLFITHDLAIVRQVADRVAVMREGVIVEAGTVDCVLSQPQHEYTQRLLRAVPKPLGAPPALSDVPVG